jgi:hypothetical protein
MKTLRLDAVMVQVDYNLPTDLGGRESTTVHLQLLTPVWYNSIDRMSVSIDKDTYKALFGDGGDVTDRYEVTITKKQKTL